MAKIIGSPGRYIQGKGEIRNLCRYAAKFGNRLLILISASGTDRVGAAIAEAKAVQEAVDIVYEIFPGECSRNEISRVMEACKAAGCDVVAGVGGGKILDTAKAAAHYMGLPVITVPTAASTDAPCSTLSVIYTDEGLFEETIFLPTSPDLVLVDTSCRNAGSRVCCHDER